jgi:hypothetical protein
MFSPYRGCLGDAIVAFEATGVNNFNQIVALIIRISVKDTQLLEKGHSYTSDY